jgi:hypothetical protein
MFKPMANNRPFLKMAFEGFAGDGKTFTAAKVAIGVHQLIQSTKPIAIYDTEKAAKALRGLFQDAGIEVMVAEEQRSLASLKQAIEWCEAGNADILIIDSITHVWEELLRQYTKEKRKTRLEFQDWGIIKPKWKEEFSTPFVNAKVHIIFTGRAGYEYGDEKDKETGKREIFKTGIKMKAETETAFEPDILVLMEKVMDTLSETKSVYRIATILKDRTDRIDGKAFKNPDFAHFAPAIKVLLDGTYKENTEMAIRDKFDDAEGKSLEYKRRRAKSVGELDGTFQLIGWGTGAKDKQLKAATLKKLFGVTSDAGIDDVNIQQLERGVGTLKVFAEQLADELQRRGSAGMEGKEIGELLDSCITQMNETA